MDTEKKDVVEEPSAPKSDAKAAKPVAPTNADGQLTMQAKIYSPFKVYYDGEAVSISAESATGAFDILPKHHNFITLLTPCDVVVRTGKDEETFTISGGIMHVKADIVVVFLDV